MAEKNTQGAVHLTSLSLDLTQFNENIQQIQDSIAQTADVAVQRFSQMREELNKPLDVMTLNVNTQQFTQGMEQATRSVQKFSEETKSALGSLSDANIDALLKGLNVPFSDKDESNYQKFKTTLQSLRGELEELGIEYKKIQVTTKEGDLFRAVVESSDEAGRTIQNTFSLAEGAVENLGTKIVEKSTQSARALKEQSVSADVLKQKFSDLSQVADALATKFSDADMQLKFPEVAEQASRFKEEVQKASEALKNNERTVEESNAVYNSLFKTQSLLSKTWNDITRQARESSSATTVNVDQINRLALQFANLANTLQKSKWSEDSVVKALAEDAKQAELELKLLTAGIETGNITVADATKEYDGWYKRLTFLKTQFSDVGYEQQQFLSKSEDAQKLADGYEALQLKLAKLATNMSNFSVKFDTPELESLISETQNLQAKAGDAAKSLREVGLESGITEQDLLDLTQQAKSLNLAFESNKKGAADYNKSLQPIQQQAKQTVDALKVLEKSATFTTSKQKVAELRAQYEQFINQLKTTHIGTDEAYSQLDKLQKKFTELEGSIKTGHTWLETWVNKISESAKWQIANRALNLIRQSFGDLTGTIIDTENAVIELQRVLNDKSLANSAISDELYNIAYEFGQTFDAVQEVAVKFAQTGIGWQATVDATRATMLGLNTAELEVSTATEGLIAVMAQFNLEASDLEVVIDKINKTADNFPVTSEKIVSALQRAGGTANAFGLSLEETIGIITALGEATGRAGEAIGTAMNSLISFSMKDTSLAKFSEFLGKDVTDYGVLELWQELSKEIKNAGDEGESFASKMATSAEFSGLMNEELASAIGLTEEYNKATEETNQMLKDGKDIYSVVGTYRQNYFIALLNNIETAQHAIEGMDDALGYSMRENATAMEAFMRQWNQLTIVAQELAVQFGEAGFLDLMKDFAGLSTVVLQTIKNLGGLRTALGLVASAVFAVKKEKINGYFKETESTVRKLPAAFEAYKAAVAAGATKTQAMSAAVSTLEISLGGLLSALSLVLTGISFYNDWLEKNRQKRQESIQQGKEEIESINNLSKAYNSYTEAFDSGDIESSNEKRKELIKLLGYEEDDIEKLVERYHDLKDGYGSTEEAIRTLTEQEYELARATALQAKVASEAAFKDVAGENVGHIGLLLGTGDEMDKFFEKFKANLGEADLTVRDVYNKISDALNGVATSSDEAEEKVRVLNAVLKASGEAFTDSEYKAHEALLRAVTERTKNYSVAIKNNEEAIADYNAVAGPFDEYLQQIAVDEEETAKSTDELANSTFDASAALEAMEKAVDALNKKIDSFQSAYKTLTDVVAEYNETGYMSADMLQSILALEPEYIELLDVKSGSLTINEERLQDLIAANDDYLNQLVALQTAEAIDNEITIAQAASKAGLTVEEYKLQAATSGLTSQTYALVRQFFDGEITTEQFKNEIVNLAEQAGIATEYLSGLTDTVYGLAEGYGAFYTSLNNNQSSTLNDVLEQNRKETSNRINTAVGNIKRYYAPSTSSKKSSSSASIDPYKEQRESLNKLLDAYEHSIFLIEKNEKTTATSTEKIVAVYRKMQEAVHAQAEKYRAAGVAETDSLIMDLSEKWWSYQDKIEDVLEGLYDEIVKTHKNAINTLEHEYESAEQRLDYSYMGENLKKQLDYQVKIQKEAERELERLAKLGMDANSDAAQDVINTWYDAEKAIREIGQKIAADILEPFDDFIDLADHFELWEYMDFTKVDYLRDKLAALNKLLEDGTISAKEYSAQLKSLSYAIYDAQKELYEQEKQTVSDNLKNVTDGYKAQQDELKKQKDQLNDYYDTLIDGYNKEIEAWNKKKEQVEDYYDTLIDNLRDVEKANERINKQVDYYNARQKIITNLEQAQARSGVEWREKEMEYQQQLIDLDEEWRRTLEDWSIEDQIEALEKLKDAAIADIDLSIQKIRDTIELTEQAKQNAIDAIEAEINAITDLITAAEEAAEAEIEVINDKIKDMSKIIADSIKDGTVDGLVNSRAELDKALVDGTNALLGFIEQNRGAMENSALQTANNVYGTYDTYFITPMNESIINIASTMASSIASGAEQGAKQALSTFQTSFITPLKNEMASLMKDVQTANTTIANASTASTVSAVKKITTAQAVAFNGGLGPVSADTGLTPARNAAWTLPGFVPTPVTSGSDTAKNIFITNNVRNVTEAANETQRSLASFGYK